VSAPTAAAPVAAVGRLSATVPGRVVRSRAQRVRKVVLQVVAVLIAVLWVFPIYWMVNSSLQSSAELSGDPHFWPSPAELGNYGRILSDPTFWSALRVSATVTVIAVAVALFSAFFAAVALTRFRFRGRTSMVITVLVIQMIPAEALFISQYRMLDGWGLINSVVGLGLLYAGHSVPITIWMLKGFVDGVPADLEEAAMIDGCSRPGAFLRITLPLLAPGLVASGIFALLASWNEYTLALVVMKDNSSATLPLWLARFNVANEATDWGAIMAGSTLVALPVVVVFLIVQGRMAKGLVAGAVKG
jgi:N,N'-diacetylchitobiose transport system permease protein